MPSLLLLVRGATLFVTIFDVPVLISFSESLFTSPLLSVLMTEVERFSNAADSGIG
jgi:hypothetical protein